MGGFCAETGGSIVLISTALMGIPVSTTHTIAGAIMGVGATRRLSAVRWGIAGKIVAAWVLTLPVSAAFAALIYYITELFYVNKIHPNHSSISPLALFFRLASVILCTSVWGTGERDQGDGSLISQNLNIILTYL